MTALEPIDYGRSFTIAGADGPGNAPRMWIDSRTRIFSEADGTYEDYYRTDACVTERTFGSGQIFPKETWLGSRIWGQKKTWFYRHKIDADASIGTSRPQEMVYDTDGIWGPVRHHLVEAGVEELTDDAAIIEATRAGRVLIGQTEICNDDYKLRAIIEYPIKTMNTLRADGFERLAKYPFPTAETTGRSALYQVDTGPVAFAHLERDCEEHYERIQLAYVAFNAPDQASFMLFEPAPLLDEQGNVKARVHGYHRPVLLPATNRAYAMKD